MYKLLLLLAAGAPVFTVVTGLQGAVLTITTEYTGVVEYPCWWILIFDALLLFGVITRRVWALIIATSPSFPMSLELYTYLKVAQQPTGATTVFYASHIFLYATCALIGVASSCKQMEI
jgi:hypothetical protein